MVAKTVISFYHIKILIVFNKNHCFKNWGFLNLLTDVRIHLKID